MNPVESNLPPAAALPTYPAKDVEELFLRTPALYHNIAGHIEVGVAAQDGFVVDWGDGGPVESVPAGQTSAAHDYAESKWRRLRCYNNQGNPIPLDAVQITTGGGKWRVENEHLAKLRGLACGGSELDYLPPLDGLVSLEELTLSGTQLAALPSLRGLPALARIDLSGNQLSAAAIDRLLLDLDGRPSQPGGDKTLDYSDNPGSADGQRSPDATAARASLEAKGFIITSME